MNSALHGSLSSARQGNDSWERDCRGNPTRSNSKDLSIWAFTILYGGFASQALIEPIFADSYQRRSEQNTLYRFLSVATTGSCFSLSKEVSV